MLPPVLYAKIKGTTADFSDQNMQSLVGLDINRPDLLVVNISRNPLSSLEGISNLRNLTTLTLTRTGVTSLARISNLLNLQSLTASNSQITDISGLRNLFNLQILYLDGNRIQDISQLSVFTYLNKIQRLWLQNNPVCSNSDYQQTLFKCVPQTIKNLSEQVLSANEQKQFRIPETVLIIQPVQPLQPFLPPVVEEVKEVKESSLLNEIKQLRIENQAVYAKQESIEKRLDKIEEMLKIILGTLVGPENI
ncbi:Leucine_rich repeats-containing protein [Hexamita inflata]|uniref:Leucine rich repeats-containing protein n=1 Tax=Hexamita inflata TaxID=28002 RepID=A0AA86RR00_9EUKA|nr:Leucine rich repeats-containing protein [Hexamita inflata]